MAVVGSMIGSGRTSELYSYGTDSVLKVLRPDVPHEWASIEFDNARLAYGSGVPSPEPRALVTVGDRPAIVYERIDGPTLWDDLVDGRINSARAAAVLVELVGAVAQVTAPDGMTTLEDRLLAKLSGVVGLSRPDRRLARRLIADLATGPVLVHGDLHPGNVIMAGEPVLVDWFDAARGSTLADPARTALLIGPDPALDQLEVQPLLDLPHLPGATTDRLAALSAEHRLCVVSEAGADRFDDLVAVMALCRVAENAQPADGLYRRWASVSKGPRWSRSPRSPLSWPRRVRSR